MENWLKTTFVYYIPVIMWMVFIFLLSNQPKAINFEDGLINLLLSKVAHLTEYAVLIVLWFLALHKKFIFKKNYWKIPFLLTTIYAVSDEIHQIFISTREGNLRDITIDMFGGIIGLWIVKNIFPKVPKIR